MLRRSLTMCATGTSEFPINFFLRASEQPAAIDFGQFVCGPMSIE